MLDCRHDPPTGGAHRENCQRTGRARTKLKFVGGKGRVRLDIGQQEAISVLFALEGQVQQMSNPAMRAITTDDEGSSELGLSAFRLYYGVDAVVPLFRRQKRRVVLYIPALSAQFVDQ